MNKDKISLFLAGVDSDEAYSITSFGFPICSLPIRYLGLPLMSRKLKISEYAPLLEKITNIFKKWTVKTLSFAERAQLIASVI